MSNNDLELSISNLAKEFSNRDPYQSGIVSRSEFTFVLVRNGGMLTQIDALADRFAVPTHHANPSSVDYRAFVAHMRALARGAEELEEGMVDTSDHHQAAHPHAPPISRDLTAELNQLPPSAALLNTHAYSYSHTNESVPSSTTSAMSVPRRIATPQLPHPTSTGTPTGGALSSSSYTVKNEMYRYRNNHQQQQQHESLFGARSCYDQMEAIAALASSSSVPRQDRLHDFTMDQASTAASATSFSPVRSNIVSMKDASLRRKESNSPASSAHSPRQAPSPSQRTAPVANAPLSCSAAIKTTTSSAMDAMSQKISLREVFRMVASESSGDDVTAAALYASLTRRGVTGLSIPQLEALMDSVKSDESASMTAEEFCVMVSRLPPSAIAAIRLRATWFGPLPVKSDIPEAQPGSAKMSSAAATPQHVSPVRPSVSDKEEDGSMVLATMQSNYTDATAKAQPQISRQLNFQHEVHSVQESTLDASSSQQQATQGFTETSYAMQDEGLNETRTPRNSYAKRAAAAASAAAAAASSPSTSSIARSRTAATSLGSQQVQQVVPPPSTAALHQPRNSNEPRLNGFQRPTASSSRKRLPGGVDPQPVQKRDIRLMSSASSVASSSSRLSSVAPSSRQNSRPSSARSSRTTSPMTSTSRSGAAPPVERVSVRTDSSSRTLKHAAPLPLHDRYSRGATANHATQVTQNNVFSVSPESASPSRARPSMERGSLPQRLVELLAGRCAQVMSLCSSVDHTRSGMIAVGPLISILRALSPPLSSQEVMHALEPYRRGRGGGPVSSDDDCFDYVQFVGDLIVCGTPTALPMLKHERETSNVASDHPTPAAAERRFGGDGGYVDPYKDGRSPTPQPRQALGMHAVAHSYGHSTQQQSNASSPSYRHQPSWQLASPSPPPPPPQGSSFQMVQSSRSKSKTPSMDRSGDDAHLSLEERVRVGRERVKRLLKHELLGAVDYDSTILYQYLLDGDIHRQGYLDEKQLRFALMQIFERSGKTMPAWAMDRAVKIAKVPFDLLRKPMDNNEIRSELTAAEQAARRAAGHYLESAPRNTASIMELCDYRFLLADIGLAKY